MTETTTQDRDVLRRLAEEVAEIAALPVQRERAELWRKLNDRQAERPMLVITQLPWNELSGDDELALQVQDPALQGLEWGLRATLYQWRHMPGDMIVEPWLPCPLAISDTGFGIGEDVRVIQLDQTSGIVSREFHRQITTEADLEKIKTPVLSHDAEETERRFALLHDTLGDILEIRKVGVVHYWFAPWDELIRWWTVQDAMMDLILKPELVHAAMDRLVNAYLARLDQWEALNVLSLTDGNYGVGSGGLGYTSAIPPPDFNPARVRPCDQWGCATAQIFSEVSPAMHWEFALQYELRWLSRFGINYYGCCEPLHTKLDILREVPNLRKVSMSPKADPGKMMARNEGRYVLSFKPNPAFLATDHFNEAHVREDLQRVLRQTEGCATEVILKDVSTVRYDPQRLWRWAEVAREVVEGG